MSRPTVKKINRSFFNFKGEKLKKSREFTSEGRGKKTEAIIDFSRPGIREEDEKTGA